MPFREGILVHAVRWLRIEVRADRGDVVWSRTGNCKVQVGRLGDFLHVE